MSNDRYMGDVVVFDMDRAALKFIPRPVPAHWRYWRLVGLAEQPKSHSDRVRIQVYGWQQPGFDCPVGVRV